MFGVMVCSVRARGPFSRSLKYSSMYAVLVLMVNGFYGFSRGYLSVSPPGISAAVSIALILGGSNSNDCLAASSHIFSG